MTRAPLLGRKAFPIWQQIGTRWSDKDMYGHVNNVVYYAWFDTVVNRWLIEAGLLDTVVNRWLIEAGLLALKQDPVIGLVVQSSCRYASPLAYPDIVEIGLMADHVGTSSVTYRLGVFAQGAEESAAEGLFTHVYVDVATRRPTPLPEVWRAALARLSPQ